MAVVDLKGVYRVRAKGRDYYYAWKGKGAPRIKAEPGSAAFVQELAEAQATRKTGDKERLAGLCARYRMSDAWTNLSPKTRESWSPWLDRIQTEFGELKLEQFDRPTLRTDIRAWRDKYKATPRSADMGLQMFSRLLAYGAEEGRLANNIITAIPRLYKANRADIIWTDADLAELAKHASAELMNAAKLAAYTGLRQADVLRLSWNHVGQHAIEVRTAKTGKTVLIPLHKKLRDFLATFPAKRKSPVILLTSSGRPWRTGFGASWNTAKRKAGLTRLHFHDLRGTAATELYKADLTPREIAGIMGWSEARVEQMLDMYVRRDDLMRDRIRRMDEAEARTAAEKLGEKPADKSVSDNSKT